MLAYIREMFVYDDWANQRSLRSLTEMEHPPERARKVMAHIVAAQLLWLSRLKRETQLAPVWPEFGLADCARQINTLRRAWEDYLGELTNAGLDAAIEYTNSKRETYRDG
jgi:uncharacterized damage-inducible protein DinB